MRERPAGPATMPVHSGDRFGPYEIQSQLGVGGMGEVWKARDTRLDRTVALKISQEQFNERFEREAKAISALNHPHICTLHDIGQENGLHYLVMELVEGETLADRLRKGPVGAEQAVRIAVEIAGALEAAHRKGIAHRDLKPGNIMLTKSGVKLLDFGLAKMVVVERVADTDATITMATPLTSRNMIIGTPQYMAPEQIEGLDADARADIFAFGCVLYEMLSGRRAFDGKSATSILAAILEREPEPLPATGGRLDWLIRRCLAKDREDRFQSIHDVRLELEREPDAPAPKRVGGRREIVAWTALALCLAALGAVWWNARTKAPPSLKLTRITSDAGVTSEPDISPDGKLVVYASDRDGQKNFDLYVQQVPGGSPVRITQADENETEPAFSPDGASIAFHSAKGGGGIYIMPALGGAPRLLVRGGHTPRFSPDGNWIAYWTGALTEGDFSAEGTSRALVIPSSGGTPRQICPEFTVSRNPIWSPDARLILFDGVAPGSGPPSGRRDYWVIPLDGGKPESIGFLTRLRRLGPRFGWPAISRWTREGLFVSLYSGDTGHIYRFPVDRNGKASGEAVLLTNGTALDNGAAVSRQGQMVFSSGNQRIDVWGVPVDGNSGKVRGAPYRITDSLAAAIMPSLSGDGRKLLFGSLRNGRSELWLRDLLTGKESVAVTAPGGVLRGVWLRTSGRIAYSGAASFSLLDPSTGESRKVTTGGLFSDSDPKEQTALLRTTDSALPSIDAVDMNSGRRTPLLRAEHWPLYQAHFSPDGRWLIFLAATGPAVSRIYAARARGSNEIPQSEWLPVTDGKERVDKPRFSPDGKLIYFTLDREASRSIQAIRFNPESGHPVGEPFLVYEFRGPRLSMAPVNLGPLEISVGPDKIVTLVAESSSNIWMAEPETQR